MRALSTPAEPSARTCSLKKSEIKKGKLVKLTGDSQRWSNFIETNRIGIIIGHDNRALAKVLFTDGKLGEHWYFSLESVSETT